MNQTNLPIGNRAAPAGTASLDLTGPSLRLRAAMDEHDKLLAKVARRRRDLDRLETGIRSAMTVVASRMAPLAEEGQRLDQEVHAMFEALLSAKRPQRARKEIRRVYLELQETGALSSRDEVEGGVPDGDGTSDGMPFGFGDDDSTVAEAQSAPKPQDRGVLRDLYRRLVEALHPDKVQDEADKAHRTEVMKDVTVAYRESDFARLVEIERAWAAAPVPVAGEDDVERRHAALVAANLELRKQLRALERQLRLLRRSPEGQLAKDMDRRRQSGRDAAVASIVEEAESDLNQLREVHAFVSAFRDGKMSLAEFIEVPWCADDADDDIDLDEVLVAFMGFAGEVSEMNRRNGPRGRKPGRKARK